MFKDISLWALFIWAFVGYLEYSLNNVNEPTIFGIIFKKLGADFHPGAEVGWFIIAFLTWFVFGWSALAVVVLSMSLQLVISVHLFKYFYRRGSN